jgi:hypothetical protein
VGAWRLSAVALAKEENPLVQELREWWKLGKMFREGQISLIDAI